MIVSQVQIGYFAFAERRLPEDTEGRGRRENKHLPAVSVNVEAKGHLYLHPPELLFRLDVSTSVETCRHRWIVVSPRAVENV
jgi:hypothetical protein